MHSFRAFCAFRETKGMFIRMRKKVITAGIIIFILLLVFIEQQASAYTGSAELYGVTFFKDNYLLCDNLDSVCLTTNAISMMSAIRCIGYTLMWVQLILFKREKFIFPIILLIITTLGVIHTMLNFNVTLGKHQIDFFIQGCHKFVNYAYIIYIIYMLIKILDYREKNEGF